MYMAAGIRRRFPMEANMNRHSHLTEDERHSIQHGLDQGKPFKQIAREIGRDCTTISKEVRLRRVYRQTGAFGSPFNDCANREGCLENSLCAGAACRNKLCRRCTRVPCRRLCGRYAKSVCPERGKPPYACNGCGMKGRCPLEKSMYSARSAHAEYASVLSEARSGICADADEIGRLDGILSPPVLNGQSIHHVCAHSPGAVMWSEKTIYKYAGLGLFRAKNIDMPRKVRMRPRKSRHDSLKVDRACRHGRTYADYREFTAGNPQAALVEMDTVHGVVGGKCLLTLHFVAARFMLACLLCACSAEAVKNAFAGLRRALGAELHARMFGVILTDNGSEFSDPKSIEFDGNGECVSRVFYCGPGRSDQKGAAENNHEMIRRVIPKGVPIENYSERDISLMMNHINSYGRKSLNGRSPHEMLEFMYGAEAMKKLGAELVPADKIVLRPSLIEKK
jgi:IS30 family transposase